MSRERTSRALREASAIALFLALAVVATRPLAWDLGSRTLAGPDPLVDLWTIHWLTSHFTRPLELFGGNIFYPAPNAVLYSDLSLGTAVLVLPLRRFLRDAVPLYNAATILALAFSGWAFYRLARHLTRQTWPSVACGILAGFASHQLHHVYHLNLLGTGWLALYVLGLHRLVEAPSLRAALLAGVSFALAAQSTGYYAVAAVVLGGAFVATNAASFKRSRVVVASAGAALVALILTTPYAKAFADLKERDGLRRPIGMSAQMAFRPWADFGSHAYGYRRIVGTRGERLFPGLLVLGFAAYALRRRGGETTFYLVAVCALLVLSFGPRIRLGSLNVPLPYALVFRTPPLDAMRHPYTFAAVATLLLAVVAAFGIARLSLRWAWTAPVATLLAILETLAPPVNVRTVRDGLPPAYAALASLPAGAILEVPVFEPDTLLWAARHGMPVVNGIGAFLPPETGVLERNVRNHWVERTPVDVDESKPTSYLIERFDPRYVVIPSGRRPAYRDLAEAFDRSRTFRFVVESADGDRIYEVRKHARNMGG